MRWRSPDVTRRQRHEYHETSDGRYQFRCGQTDRTAESNTACCSDVVSLLWIGIHRGNADAYRTDQPEHPADQRQSGALFLHHDGASDHRYLRLDLSAGLCGIHVPDSVLDEKAALQRWTGKLRLADDHHRFGTGVDRGVHLALCAALYSLLAAAGRSGEPLQYDRRDRLRYRCGDDHDRDTGVYL